MTSFEQSRWAEPSFAQEYLDNADHYIPDRFHLFSLLRSFYRAFVKRNEPTRLCDLGCGDGVLTDQLLREDPTVEPTLVDGSPEMLSAAAKRFQDRPQVRYLQRGLQELSQDSAELGRFHFIVSSFAIHHLARPERQQLFQMLPGHLEPRGWFLNIEVVMPDQALFNDWYFQFWQEWIERRSRLLGMEDKFLDVPQQARAHPDNQYSPLADQLSDLTTAGFADLECFYKNGLFAIYAGRRLG